MFSPNTRGFPFLSATNNFYHKRLLLFSFAALSIKRTTGKPIKELEERVLNREKTIKFVETRCCVNAYHHADRYLFLFFIFFRVKRNGAICGLFLVASCGDDTTH